MFCYRGTINFLLASSKDAIFPHIDKIHFNMPNYLICVSHFSFELFCNNIVLVTSLKVKHKFWHMFISVLSLKKYSFKSWRSPWEAQLVHLAEQVPGKYTSCCWYAGVLLALRVEPKGPWNFVLNLCFPRF